MTKKYRLSAAYKTFLFYSTVKRPGMGEAHVILEDGTRRDAACIGGMLSVMDGKCNLLATTWEWKEDIDEDRAEKAKKKAEEKLSRTGLSEQDYKIAKAKLHRAMVRLSVKQ